MIANPTESHLTDPDFQAVMLQFQNGSWEAGLRKLDAMVEKYPLNHQLRTLRQEMRMRARIDADEIDDHRQANRRKARRIMVRLGVVIAALTLLLSGVIAYSSWIQNQWSTARARIQSEVQMVEMAVTFRDGQDLLQVGRYTEALALFDQVSSVNPEFPGLKQAMNQADKMLDIEVRYQLAVQLMDQREMTQALELLEAIQAEEPYYKDISIRISDIQGSFFLGDILAQADKAYTAEDWPAAASSYETLRALNPQYESKLVDERLFNSYMSAAVAALSTDSNSLEALEVAEIYFRKALALRPQDPVIQLEREQARQTFKDRLYRSYVDAAAAALVGKADSIAALAAAEDYFQKALDLKPDDALVQTQRRLAQLFIQAQTDFEKGSYTDVITALEEVIAEDPDYASGTARQTVYEAYIARGNIEMLATVYEESLADFQRAAVLAEESDQSTLRLYQAQYKIAEVQGILGEYETAVTIYRAAIQLANLDESELQRRPELTSKLKSAEQFAQSRNYRTAYKYFRDAARTVFVILPQVTHVVKEGEYITQIASQYNTTVEAILQANNLGSSRTIAPGRSLNIPVQP